MCSPTCASFPTVHQEVSSDGTSWTLLGLPAVSHLDSGDYICQAKNFLGASETLISLVVSWGPQLEMLEGQLLLCVGHRRPSW